ncbi:EcsC family protein [Vallitalea pronyensis]|uniref:EcsC family protein n=1 Tax=Vallitalea pronyensis TaxID=1348613 RepID=A0A8J8MHM4_9FIRM|nr:EcsC family protein [Vallitalea pronyensis]QUI21810.1 EcsC family protein [Vallitalea pronyensis]
MDYYEQTALKELNKWKKKMRRKPTMAEQTSKGIQNKLNDILPEKYHELVTEAIKNMTKLVLFGSKYITKTPYMHMGLHERELLVSQLTKRYRTTALIEGAGTGAGGILLGLADLPLLMSIKIKMLYDIAAAYGYDVYDYRERIYILSIFQLAFSSKSRTNEVYAKMENFQVYLTTLPEDINSFDWRTFQLEYRDYIDLAKLLQMIPGFGAVVGAYVNTKLINKLSHTAMQAYRMRFFN